MYSIRYTRVTNYLLEWMDYYYDGLQPKMMAAIINEHECIVQASIMKDSTYFSTQAVETQKILDLLMRVTPCGM